MINENIIRNEFKKFGGILKTIELNSIGLSSRQIKKLLDKGFISKIKFGYYELTDEIYADEVIISKLFPEAIIYLESALVYYGYTDRIPSAWQIAINRDSKNQKYKIDYPLIKPFYIKSQFMEIGVDIIKIEGLPIKIFNRERTICDILRYENKLEREVFTNAIQSYLKDDKKNLRILFEYAEIFNIQKKVQIYIGVWL